jgi:myosin heavy subunit
VPLKLKAARAESKRVGLNDGFIVRHYAGEVEYRTLGWIQKNNDALVPQIEGLFASSQKKLVRTLAGPDTSDDVQGERFTSVSSNYLGNLNDLLATLQRCKLHYIRCFNPNDKRAPGVFNSRYVLDQVVQCGTVELVDIMHNGYPNRCKLDEIRKRFSNLLPVEFQQYAERDFVEAILLAFEIDKTEWTVGLTRLFLKAGQLRVLEYLLDSGSAASKEMLKKIRLHFVHKKMETGSHRDPFRSLVTQGVPATADRDCTHSIAEGMPDLRQTKSLAQSCAQSSVWL